MGNANGDSWADGDNGFTRRGNAKSIFHGTGTEIAALDPVTPTSRYAFAGNGNDSVGSNNLTANGSPTYGSDGGVYGQYVILNGSSQYFTASANTVFDITTNDFSLWGYFYRSSDSGGAEIIAIKQDTGASTNKGYGVYINTTDKLVARLCDGSATQLEATSTSSISTGVWYFWAASFTRAGNMVLYLYNMSTGAYETATTAISSQALTITNTQTFTVGRLSVSAGNYFPGRIDHLNVLIGTAITAQNVQDIISKLHGGQIAQCHGTSGGFTSGLTYKRDMENTTWYQLVDTNNTQTITGAKTMNALTAASPTFTGTAVLKPNSVAPFSTPNSGLYITESSDNIARIYMQSNSGSSRRKTIYVDNSNNFNIADSGDSGAIFTVDNSGNITNYGTITPGGVDAGLVNPLFHLYGRRSYDLSDLDYLSNAYATGSNVKDTAEGGFTLTTGAASTNKQSAVYPSISANQVAFRRDRKWEAAFLIEVVTNDANTYFELGFTTDVVPDLPRTTTASISFKFDPGTSANWIVRNANGTTQTTTTSGVAVSANTVYYLYMINNESSIKFYINGTLVATHTTNLPTATTTMAAEMIVRTGTTAAKSLKILNGTRVWVDDQT